MTELFELQEQFQRFLLSEESEIHTSIVHTKSVSVDTRLGIYRDAYELRLIECLTANFPMLYTYLGTEEFNKFARDYISANPSTYRSIRWFGDSLVDFLKHYYPKNLHLAELADFEWKMTLTFDAADATVIKIEDMAVVPAEAWPHLQFVLHPSVQLSNFTWNVVPIWQALAHDQELPDLQHHSEKSNWILWRAPKNLIQFYSLSEEEAWALDALSQRMNFSELCEGLCQWIEPEDVGMQAASYLKSWIQKGILAELLIV